MAIGFALGLAGAILMFVGDMLLYFTRGSYNMDGTLRPYMEIMRGAPARVRSHVRRRLPRAVRLPLNHLEVAP